MLSHLQHRRNHRRRKSKGEAAAAPGGMVTGGHMIPLAAQIRVYTSWPFTFRRATERSNAVQTSTVTFPEHSGEPRNASNERAYTAGCGAETLLCWLQPNYRRDGVKMASH